MKPSRKVLEALLVIGLILLIPLFFTVKTMANRQAEQNTPAPVMPTTVNAPEDGNALQPKQPPACTFPLAQTILEESTPEEYTFSEPQKVTIDPSFKDIDIYQWLPDNQRVLIGGGHTEYSETGYSIELLNPQTGESQIFGARPWPSINAPPVWVPGLDAVIYPTTLIPRSSNPPLTRDSNGIPIIPPSRNYRRQLWLSKGDPVNVQPVEDEQVTVTHDRRPTVGSVFTTAISPDGGQIVYTDDTGSQLYVRKITNGSLQTVPAPSFNAAEWDYRRLGNTPIPISFQMAWRPNSDHIFLYNSIGVGGYTFLLNIQNGQICELNLFGTEDPNEWRKSWAMLAHWSLNGRYLAVVRTKGPFPLDFSDLIILDTATGNIYQTDVTKFSPSDLDVQGRHYISDVAWAPDNQHLAVIGQSTPFSGNSTSDIDRLFLSDFLTGKVVQVSSKELGTNFDIKTALLWSNDGSQLLVKCPGGLCLLSVQKNTQP